MLGSWHTGEMPSEVESVFLELQELSQSANQDLWRQLREALASNEELRHPEIQKFIGREDLAREGYWWYDSEQWTEPAPAG